MYDILVGSASLSTSASNRMNDESLTRQAAEFAAQLDFDRLPAEAVTLAKRCVLDGIGVTIAGTQQGVVRAVDRFIWQAAGAEEARMVGDGAGRVPAGSAALHNGVAGHAMDWDDTQLAEGEGRVYGLLTHPTIPPLSAGLAVADMIGAVTGKEFLAAFVAGFEVECKIAVAIAPKHYLNGFHSSGTIGTFGAAVAAAKLLNMTTDEIAQTLGVAASMASGIRANFGTMTKPLHVGRAAQNGVSAALLVREGLTATEAGLDGSWGYLAVAGGEENDLELALGRFGDPLSIVRPGVSVKPYPCGVLTHPSMDAMSALMRENELHHSEIAAVTFRAGRNILEPIRYRVATTELEAKFCMPFLLAAIMIAGRAGTSEFTDEFVGSADVQALQRRVEVVRDLEIEARGFDRIRSRIEIVTTDGRSLTREAEELYRGGPENPLSESELDEKFTDCARGLVDDEQIAEAIEFIRELPEAVCVTDVLELLSVGVRLSSEG